MFKRSIKLQRLLNTLYLFAYKNTTLTSDVYIYIYILLSKSKTYFLLQLVKEQKVRLTELTRSKQEALSQHKVNANYFNMTCVIIFNVQNYSMIIEVLQ